MTKSPVYLQAARQAYLFLRDTLQDKQDGGFWWVVHHNGRPVMKEKIIYGQAFAIYGLSEYYRASGDTEALALAEKTYGLLERSARDKTFGGYAEACDRGFTRPIEKALSDVDIPCAKSMNTNLHVMEAFSALLLANGKQEVQESLRSLIDVYVNKVFTADEHLSLYFTSEWKSTLEGRVSFGHDIESTWLVAEACEIAYGARENWPQGTADKMLKAARSALKTAKDNGGPMPDELVDGKLRCERIWWVQAESIVGFINAFEQTGEDEFLSGAEGVWDWIEKHMIDREHGDWFYEVDDKDQPVTWRDKGGLWKTCYHNGRACMEVVRRAAELTRSAQ
jgi:mannobiose 2-epimerase